LTRVPKPFNGGSPQCVILGKMGIHMQKNETKGGWDIITPAISAASNFKQEYHKLETT
jgi:hypothetical protein